MAIQINESLDTSISCHNEVRSATVILSFSQVSRVRRDSKKNEQFIISFVRTIHELFGKYVDFLMNISVTVLCPFIDMKCV